MLCYHITNNGCPAQGGFADEQSAWFGAMQNMVFGPNHHWGVIAIEHPSGYSGCHQDAEHLWLELYNTLQDMLSKLNVQEG